MKNLKNVKQRDYYLPPKIMMGIKSKQVFRMLMNAFTNKNVNTEFADSFPPPLGTLTSVDKIPSQDLSSLNQC